MNRVVPLSIIVGALAYLVAPASAQMTSSKGTTHSSAGAMQAMMPECSAMMKEFMADPIVQKRMMAIMQKHMKQHSGQGSMMMMQGTAGAKAMQSGSAGSGSAAHEAHHSAEPAAMPTAAAVPSPTPSP